MRFVNLLLLPLLIACHGDDLTPTPATVRQLIFAETGTIAGIAYRLTLSDELQVFNKPRCERIITYPDWRSVLSLFDKPAFDQVPPPAANECCDQALYELTLITTTHTYSYKISSFTSTPAVAPLIQTLARRAADESMQCR